MPAALAAAAAAAAAAANAAADYKMLTISSFNSRLTNIFVSKMLQPPP